MAYFCSKCKQVTPKYCIASKINKLCMSIIIIMIGEFKYFTLHLYCNVKNISLKLVTACFNFLYDLALLTRGISQFDLHAKHNASDL